MTVPKPPISEKPDVAFAIVVTTLVCLLQLIAASKLELMFDEAYYSLWARHLNWGYHDHPPAIAAWIRVSTSLFGNSEFGIRALGVLATALGSWAIWSIARDLFASIHKAALAVLIWNACPLIGVGAVLVTPDTPLMFGSTTMLWALGRVHRTADWRWWLLVGTAAGVALEGKYTALFLGPGILLAMSVVPSLRKWWSHPAPYAGGALAFAVFAPNVWWNATHGWETFAKQFGRLGDTEWTHRFLLEFFGSQIGLLNPLTFVLVVAGLMFATRPSADGEDESRRLLAALAAPLLVYFGFHSLHDRVQGNWLAPLYPVFALLAADAAFTTLPLQAWQLTLLAFAKRWTAPLGLGLSALIYVQAFLAPLPISAKSDPTALLSGWRTLAGDLDAVAMREGAAYVLTQGYALTGLLSVYSPNPRPVFQYSERYRWSYDATAGEPEASKPGLYIVETRRAGGAQPRGRFKTFIEIEHLERKARGRVLETYVVYRVAEPIERILDPETSERTH